MTLKHIKIDSYSMTMVLNEVIYGEHDAWLLYKDEKVLSLNNLQLTEIEYKNLFGMLFELSEIY